MNNYNYKKLTPFKWFILENFPLIDEDFDALTNWQLFCKLGQEMNKLIDSQNSVGTQMENVTNAFIVLQDYVNNYFDNLDVQDEINNKLDAMVQDGTLQGVFIGQSNNTIYIKNETDISDTLENLTDGETLVLQKGAYTCDNAEITADNVTLICEDGTTITTEKTAFIVSGDNFHMVGGKVIGPEAWYPATSVALYGVIEVENKSIFENVTLYNISKIGLYVQDAIKCINCEFLGNMPATYYTSTSANNQVYGLYIKASEGYSETSKVINCKFTDLIEGVYFGDYDYPNTAYSVLVSECTFDKIYDHACYINGGKAGIISNCIAHNSNHTFVMMGQNHTISNNTIYLPVGDNNVEVTGVSLREPLNGKIINNTIYGYGITNSAGIMLQNLSGDPEPNTKIEKVLIANNIMNTTGLITPIRIGNTSQTTLINNLEISNNIFDCVNSSNRMFIEFQSANVSNCQISNNMFTLHNLFAFGIHLNGGTCDILNNTFEIKDMESNSSTNQNIINGSFTGKIKGNRVYLTNSSLTNINLHLLRCTSTTGIEIEENVLPANAKLLSNIAGTWDSRFVIRNNIVGSDSSSGTVTTNATGAITVNNKTFFGGINNAIIKPHNQAGAVYSNYYITANNGANAFTIYTTDVTTNIDLDYYIY